jgi:hypothetical protein
LGFIEIADSEIRRLEREHGIMLNVSTKQRDRTTMPDMGVADDPRLKARLPAHVPMHPSENEQRANLRDDEQQNDPDDKSRKKASELVITRLRIDTANTMANA